MTSGVIEEEFPHAGGGRWWHVYRGELSSFEGATASVTCEDSPKRPEEMPKELEGLRYIVSFDHEPSEKEMRKVVGV